MQWLHSGTPAWVNAGQPDLKNLSNKEFSTEEPERV
jgi:hypothetical protein